MNTHIVRALALALAVGMLAGCGSAANTGSAGQAGASAVAAPAAGQPTLLPTYASQSADSQAPGSLASSAASPGSDTSALTPGAGATEPVVTSPGGTVQTSSGSEPGAPGSADGSPATAGAPTEQPVQWQVFSDKALGFSIQYPSTYQAASDPAAQTPAGLLGQIRFSDTALAASDSGLPELPQFTVDVFSNSGKLPLDQWLDSAKVQGNRVPVVIDNLQGYQVTLNIELAPNQFYYIANGAHIYKLTPLGEYGEQMLKSFQARR